MNAIRLYCKMIMVSLRSQLQYRASFALHALGGALGALVEFIGVWAFFSRFGSLGSWTLMEAGVFFGMGTVAFALCEMFMREFDTFHRHVRSGEFDRTLLRPRSTVLLMMGAQCQLMRIGRLLQGAVILGISLASISQGWSAAHWILLVFSIVGGGFLFSGIIVLQATSSFWTVESIEVWNCITYGGLTTIQYPLDIYHRPLRFFFAYIVPLASMNYWPCAFLLGRDYAPVWLSWTSPAIGIAFFCISLLVWNFGVRHYRSTGS